MDDCAFKSSDSKAASSYFKIVWWLTTIWQCHTLSPLPCVAFRWQNKAERLQVYSHVLFLSLLRWFSLLPKGLGTDLLILLERQLCTSSRGPKVNGFKLQCLGTRWSSHQATEGMFVLFSFFLSNHWSCCGRRTSSSSSRRGKRRG